MPAPNTEGSTLAQEPGPGTVVESLNLEESELGSLTLGSDDQLRSELETLVNIDDELEGFHSESLITDADSHSLVAHEVTVIAEEADENLSILPHMDDEESVQQEMLSEEVLTTISEDNNLTLSEENISVECETILSSSGSSSVMEPVIEVSVAETITAAASVPTPSLTQTIASAPSGTIFHSAPVAITTSNISVAPVPVRLKSYSGPSARPVAITSVRNIKPVNSVSVPNNSNAPKSVILSKVVLSGTNVQGGMENIGPQTIRVINAGQNKIVPSPTKAITLAQARQMGLLSPGKLQQILPNPNIKKVVVSPKNTVTVVKQPTRILPAPSPAQLQSIAPSTAVSSNSQKVLIRQGGTLKPGTLVTTNTSGQVIRIPASQSLTAGNIHQIQLPPGSKQVQYVRLVSTSSTPPSVVTTSSSGKTLLPVTSVTKPVPVALTQSPHAFKMVPIAPAHPIQQNTQRVLIPAPSSVTQLKEPTTGNTTVVQGTALNNIVMVPAQYIQQSSTPVVARSQSPVISTSTPSIVTSTVATGQQESLISPSAITTSVTVTTSTTTTSVTTATTTITTTTAVISTSTTSSVITTATASTTSVTSITNSTAPVVSLQTTQHKRTISVTALEPNGIRPRKPCNCTKSQCLKLYCDCFANGEFCYLCNCVSCFNNLDHEEDRQRAIKSCLERNPNAFRPKIGKSYVGDGERRHNKGCNCKRSGCLKNYCECYEAKIPCSNNCKCVGCQNEEDGRGLRELALAAEEKVNQQAVVKNKLSAEIQGIALKPESQGPRQPFTLMTQEVVEATCQCLLAQTEDVIRVEQAQRLILEEFGRCLVQIIDCASKASQPPT
ncbi:myb-interacting protein 120 isoform X2 [Lycorma delicatula]|uniref:myb-interacting protein 120 isoform X2 n=1 Tax=Lycorma delicatula TaxID=130591 RepID=UPI003F5151CA